MGVSQHRSSCCHASILQQNGIPMVGAPNRDLFWGGVWGEIFTSQSETTAAGLNEVVAKTRSLLVP